MRRRLFFVSLKKRAMIYQEKFRHARHCGTWEETTFHNSGRCFCDPSFGYWEWMLESDAINVVWLLIRLLHKLLRLPSLNILETSCYSLIVKLFLLFLNLLTFYGLTPGPFCKSSSFAFNLIKVILFSKKKNVLSWIL